MSGGSTKEPGSRAAPPVPALLRRPAMLVRHRMIESLRAAGFVDILPAHLAVFQYPGPEGQRPGVLAARTHASKQAMNHLLHQLETAGYSAKGTRRTVVPAWCGSPTAGERRSAC